MLKKTIPIIFILIAFFNMLSFGETFSVEAGINGYGKINKPFPIMINLEKSLKEDEYICIKNGDQKIFLKGTEFKEKNINTSIIIKSNNDEILCSYIKDNELIEEKKINLNIFDDSPIIGILSEFQQSYDSDVNGNLIYIKDDFLENKIKLNTLDGIYINNFYTASLNENTIDNILLWISQGGTLMIDKGEFKDKNFSGFLESFDIKKKMDYNFGTIIPIDNLNNFLNENHVEKIYPTVDINGFRGTGKDLLKIDNKNMILMFIFFTLAIFIGIITIWFFKKIYFVVTIMIFFIIMTLFFNQPLVSVSEITWNFENGIKDIKFFHSVDKKVERVNILSEYGENCFLIGNSDFELGLNSNNVIFNDLADEKNGFLYSEKTLNSNKASIYMDIKEKDGFLVGSLTWNGDSILEKAFLYFNEELIPIGDINKGQSVNINYQLNDVFVKKEDYQRQIELINNGNWKMNEGLLFNEFQKLYKKNYEFNNENILIGGIENFKYDVLLNRETAKINGKRLIIYQNKIDRGEDFE